MPKVTIYLPDQLAEQAKALDLSLSPICQEAIRTTIDRRSAMQAATKDIEKVAARLRETIDAEDAEAKSAGHDAGVLWARETATMSELTMVVNQTFAEHWVNGPADFVARTIGEDAVYDLSAEPDEVRRPGRPRRGRHQAEGQWSDAWVEGFVEGAETVLTEVSPLI